MSDDTVTIEINGRALTARKGEMVIQAADAAGIRIPRFCYHPRLTVAANCRMCLVEVEKAPKPLPACATPVMDGMKVYTRSPLALRAQKSVMEFLLINHPLDCPICDQGGECELQDVAMGYGRDVSRFVERKRVVKDKNLGPLIATDMTRCIHCTRCVRFGEEVAGMPELGATGRGENVEIGTYIEHSVDSEMSGNVIDLCPVGALTSKPFRFRARAWEMRQHPGISPHDPVGANIHLHVGHGRVMRVVPRENDAINEVWIPDRDRFGYEGLYSEERLERPRIKRDGTWVDADWETALAFAAEGLRDVVSKRGPERLGALASPSATSEELYLLQKLVRGLGSANVDHRVRESDCRDQAAAPPFPSLGLGIAELEQLDAVLLVGSWARKEHPLVNHRLRKASLRGCKVMVLNPVDWEFNLPLAQRIVAAPSRLPGELAGIAAALDGAKGAPKKPAGPLAGVTADAGQRAIATVLAEAGRAAVLLGPAATNHPEASALRGLAAHVAERAGAVLGVLTEGANAAGAWLAGAVPHRLPGGAPAPAAGLDATAMLGGDLSAFVLLGLEPERDCANSAAALEALRRAGCVVSLTSYRTPAMEEYADVLLPVAAFAETSGTYVSLEGRWQSFPGAVRPVGEARPAWKVLRVLGNLLDLDGFDYVDSTGILEELEAAAADEVPAPGSWPMPGALPAAAASGIERIGDFPIYAVDPVVRRAAALQGSHDAASATVGLPPGLAGSLGLAAGDRATIRQNGASVTLEVALDARLPEGCARIPGGTDAGVGLAGLYAPVEVRKA